MAEITDATLNRGSSDEIRADIERTRTEMDSTFDALDEKLTPRQLLSEVWRYTKDGSSFGANKVWQLAREHPLPATMIGVGLGWLFVERARSGNVDVDYHSAYDDLKSGRFSSAVGSLKDATGHAVDSVKDAASTAREKVGDLAGTVKDRASDLGDKATQLSKKARSQSRKARTGFWQMMEQNPLAVGAAALTLGVIAGFSLPSTDKEDGLGETRDHLLDRAKETGQEVLEKTKHVAEAAVDKAKEEAEAQGLTAESLAGKAKAVVHETKNTVAEQFEPELARL